jgi:hypothetical protein
MKARSALALAAGLLAGMAVAPAGAQWVDPPAPGSAPPATPPRAEAPAPKPPAEAAKVEPKVEAKPVEAAKAEPRPKAQPVRAAERTPATAAPAGASVETTGSVEAKRSTERKPAARRIAKPAGPKTRTVARPAPRVAAKPSRERFAPRPTEARDLDVVQVRTYELPDGRQVEVLTRLGSSRPLD